MLERGHGGLSLRQQCALIGISRSTFYYEAVRSPQDTILVNEIHEIWGEMPFYGYRRITAELRRRGYQVNTKHILRLMRESNIQALYPRPKTTVRSAQAQVYPYLLRDLEIRHPNQVWATDITYLKLPVGFAYLVALIDVYSRYYSGNKTDDFGLGF
jgi:putative transposase